MTSRALQLFNEAYDGDADALEFIINALNVVRRLFCHSLYVESIEGGRPLLLRSDERFGPELQIANFNLEFPAIFMHQIHSEVLRTINGIRHPTLYHQLPPNQRSDPEGGEK